MSDDTTWRDACSHDLEPDADSCDACDAEMQKEMDYWRAHFAIPSNRPTPVVAPGDECVRHTLKNHVCIECGAVSR